MSVGREVVYGRNPVREALRGRRSVHRLWVAEGEGGEDLSALVAFWVRDAGEGIPQLEEARGDDLTQKAGSPDHQGLVVEVDPYPYADPTALLETSTLIIALDRVQDPHNLGAVIRTANAAGAAVVIPRHRSATVTPAVVKASAGATEHTPVAVARNIADVLIEARKYGFWSYGAESGGDSYLEQDYPYRTLLVLGSEGKGLGDRVRKECDVVVGVPMAGQIDSLNVGVSAAVLMFEVRRQRGREEGR